MADFVIPHSNPEVVELPRRFPQGSPETLHEGQMELEKFPENAALKAAAEALGSIWNEAGSLDELRANPHDEHRAAQHDRTVRERVDNFHRTFNEKYDNAKAGLQRELASVEAELATAAGLNPNPAHFDAITSAFHNMKPEQRAATMKQLLDEGDHASLATLAEAPLFLTGLNAAQRDAIKEMVFKKVNPQGVVLRDHLRVAVQRFDKAGNVAIAVLNSLRAGTEPGAWKVRAQQAALTAERNRLANAR